MATSQTVLTPTASTRRFAAASLCAGALAAIALPDTPVGLGMVLVAALALLAVVVSGALPRSRYTALSMALAGALAAQSVLRDAAWLLWIDLIAATAVLVLAAVDARSWPAMVRAAATWVAKLFPAPLAVGWCAGIRPGPVVGRNAAPVTRGLVLGGALVFVFGSLFASADRAFAQLSDGVLTPDLDLGLLPARVGAGLAVIAGCGAVVLAAIAPFARREPRTTTHRGAAAEWTIALGLVNALFAGFLLVQLRVMFGGEDYVQETAGVTYAHYAREGFFELLAVAFLVLAVVALAGRRRGERTGRRPTPVEFLLGLLCALTLVVLASALRRLGLLEDTYGFTLTRLFGHAGTLWVGAILALVMMAGAARRTDLLPRAIVTTTAAGLLAFSLVNPEGLVASKNVDRFERTGKIDTRYLRTLDADATPALLRLPAGERTEADPIVSGDESVFAYNLARARAR